MTTYVVPIGGERLDRIARTIFGTERGGTVEALLEANAGLAALGPQVPAGTQIIVPAEAPVLQAAPYQLAWE